MKTIFEIAVKEALKIFGMKNPAKATKKVIEVAAKVAKTMK